MNSDWPDPDLEDERQERVPSIPSRAAGRGLPGISARVRRHQRLIATVAAILLPLVVLSTILYTLLFSPQASPGSNTASAPAPTRFYDRNNTLLWTMPRNLTPTPPPPAPTFPPGGLLHHPSAAQAGGQKRAPHFVDYVAAQLALMLTDDGTLERGMQILSKAGLQVYTTLDVRLEDAVEQIVPRYLFQSYTIHYSGEDGTFAPLSAPASQGGHNINDAAVVVTDPRTGDILAMDGSGGYTNTSDIRQGGPYNAATSSLLQSGPVFMPIVYAAAFEAGWFPSLVLRDQLTCFPIQTDPNGQAHQARATCGQWYAPMNAGGALPTDAGAHPPTMAHGIRVRSALGMALNIPAMQTLYFAGLDNVITLAERLGITSSTFSPQSRGPSIALGSAGISLLDMVSAYATFANGGARVPPRAILRITDGQGRAIAGGDFQSVTPAQVLSPQTAFLITNILADNAARTRALGANSPLKINALPAAAAAGVTDNLRDVWTVGYTPALAVGVWAGNANSESMAANTKAVTGAAPIWHDVMTKAMQLLNQQDFSWPVPPGVSQHRVDGITGLPPRQGQPDTYTDWFNDAQMPPAGD